MRTLTRATEEIVAVGWSTRPAGSTTYLDTERHLRTDNGGVFGQRTLCGASIPAKALAPTSGLFAPLVAMNDAALAKARRCARCHQKAAILRAAAA